MDRDAVAGWLEAYVRAWQTYDQEAIAELFSDDAEYRYHPWDEPLRGRDAIVKDWLSTPDPPGSFSPHYEPFAVEGDVAVATGTSIYSEEHPDAPGRTYFNCYLLRFDSAGRCREFTEFYMKQTPET